MRNCLPPKTRRRRSYSFYAPAIYKRATSLDRLTPRLRSVMTRSGRSIAGRLRRPALRWPPETTRASRRFVSFELLDHHLPYHRPSARPRRFLTTYFPPRNGQLRAFRRSTVDVWKHFQTPAGRRHRDGAKARPSLADSSNQHPGASSSTWSVPDWPEVTLAAARGRTVTGRIVRKPWGGREATSPLAATLTPPIRYLTVILGDTASSTSRTAARTSFDSRERWRGSANRPSKCRRDAAR